MSANPTESEAPSLNGAVPIRVHGPGYERHRVTITPYAAAYSCRHGVLLREAGECRDGCCTDYWCPDCGDWFRVEWPD